MLVSDGNKGVMGGVGCVVSGTWEISDTARRDMVKNLLMDSMMRFLGAIIGIHVSQKSRKKHEFRFRAPGSAFAVDGNGAMGTV